MKNYKYKLSIIIPTYNRQDKIINALNSIPARDDIEVIIIDDASTDNTISVIKNYNRLHIKLISLTKNGGPGRARNFGLDAMQGEWFTFLDSDDCLVTNEFNKVIDNCLVDKYDIVWATNKRKTGADWTARVFQGSFGRSYLVENVRHPEIYWGEDQEFMMQIYKNNPSIKEVKISNCVYIYDNRPGDPTTLSYKRLVENKGRYW